MKKGTRVEFSRGNDPMEYGVVKKGGNAKITVVLDGGNMQIKADARYFRVSNYPLAVDGTKTRMDRYSVKSWQEIQGEETRNFNAVVCYDGKPIIRVSNNGCGGMNNTDPINEAYNTVGGVVDTFMKDSTAWGKEFGWKFEDGADEVWLDWCNDCKPFGKTAKTYFIEMNA